MSTPSPQIVHESETQRQYIRLQLPAMAEIEGLKLTVKDLSSGGMALKDIGNDLKKGHVHNIKLTLPFADFTLDIEVKAEIQYVDTKLKIAGCKFIDLTSSQTSILNHVIRSFISGDIMDGGEILNVVARENFVNVRKHNEDYSLKGIERLRQYILYGLIAFAIIAVSAFIIGNIMDRLFVIKTSQAQVFAETIEIKAPINGVFSSEQLGHQKTFKKGDVIGTLRPPIGNLSSNVVSPCDCLVLNRNILEGQYSAQNEVLFELIKTDQQPVIEAFIPPEDIHRLNQNIKAIVKITGVKYSLEGKIQNTFINNTASTDGIMVAQGRVLITLPSSVSIDMLNKPAFVELHL